jgi:fumarylacetoacetase
MTYEINATHDPNLKSWVESANDPATDFPIQNLPFCVFAGPHNGDMPRVGIAIGDKLVDLWGLYSSGLIDANTRAAAAAGSEKNLNKLASQADSYRALRARLSPLLSDAASDADRKALLGYLVDVSECTFAVPAGIHDYTDFYCSIYHATNVGSMFRPDNPLMPNYKYVPIGYHGRASSIVVSGTDIRRPHGQNRSDAEKPPVFIPCRNLDYEMELGFFVGRGNELGMPIPISEAEEHIFGVCLVNDWSARDIQAWEYQPLGPFLAKNFATTISAFVVTMEALAPFRTAAFEHDPDDPHPLDYLSDDNNRRFGGLDINLEVYLQTEKMRAESFRRIGLGECCGRILPAISE